MKSPGARELRLAAVRHYEYDAMVSELSHLEQLAAPRGTLESARLHSLENRPFAVRLLETRAADLFLNWVQYLGGWIASRAGSPSDSFQADATFEQPDLILGNRQHLADMPHDPSALLRRPNVLLDLTPLIYGPSSEPANRAARNMAEAAIRTGAAFPVLTVQDRTYPYYRDATGDQPIDPGQEDVLVVAGAFWTCAQAYPVILSAGVAAGARIALMLHDAYALRFPAMYPADLVDRFETAILALLPLADVVVTTGTAANDLRGFLNSVGQPMRRLRFEEIAPGVGPASVPGAVRASVMAALEGDATYISVGALEPRNGLSIALDAFDVAWSSGKDFSYAILGPYRWRSQSMRQRLLRHPELNRRLFWIDDPTDAEIAFAYRRCRATIVSSVAEADDLPILGPALHGAPVIASDLPSLRAARSVEVSFFPVGSVPSLAALIGANRRSGPAAAGVDGRTWEDYVRQLAKCLSPYR